MKKRRPMRMNPPCDCRMLFGFAESAAWRDQGQIVTIGTKARSGKGDNRHTPSAQIRRKTLIRKLALSLCLLAPVAAGAQDFFFQAEDGIRDHCVTGVQTCALPI